MEHVNDALHDDSAKREHLLDPVDRISEIVFGLIMAVTIVGSLSIATAGQVEVRTALFAALGCNLAWGLVDAVMYVVRTATERSRLRVLGKHVRNADARVAHRLIADAMPDHVAALLDDDELEAMRRKLVARPPEERALLQPRDFLEAAAVFAMVVLATFPVVAPFIVFDETAQAFRWSQAITVAMLFVTGFALGRHACYPKPYRIGIAMAVFGVVLIAVVMALGG